MLAVLAAYRLAVLLDGLGPRRAAEHGHLVGVRADDDRHVVLPSGREDVVDGVGEDPAVDVRGRPDQVGRHALHRVGARGPHRLERRRRAVAEQGLDEALAGRLDLGPGRGPAPRAEAAAALADGGVEEAAGERRRHELVDAPRAGRLAEDGHARRVAPERRDVPLDPAEGRDLVEEAVVARRPVPGLGAQQRVGEIAERPEAVVDGDQHHAALGQPRPVVGDVGAVADGQPAAVNPDEHRRAVVRPRRRPDVQVEAVLVHAVDAGVVERPHRGGQRALHARRRGLGRVAHALPGRRRLGGTPPQIAHRRGRERHAPVDHDLVAERRRRSRELPALDGHDPAGVLAHGGCRAGGGKTDHDQRETDLRTRYPSRSGTWNHLCRLEWRLGRQSPSSAPTRPRPGHPDGRAPPRSGVEAGARQESCAPPRKMRRHLVCGRGSPWIGLFRGSWPERFPVNRESDSAQGPPSNNDVVHPVEAP